MKLIKILKCINIRIFTNICIKNARWSVSRVLYLMIICLDVLLPIRSSDFATSRLLIVAFSCTKWGLHGSRSHLQDGELLPRLFILTNIVGGYFLLHFPSSHLDWSLASTLPYGARTFLMPLRACDHLAILLSKYSIV